MTIALNDRRHPMTSFTSIGIDIGKEVFRIVGFDSDGKVILRKKIKSFALEQEFAKLPPSIIGMEACLSAHFVSRNRRHHHQAADPHGRKA
jgi:transposase